MIQNRLKDLCKLYGSSFIQNQNQNLMLLQESIWPQFKLLQFLLGHFFLHPWITGHLTTLIGKGNVEMAISLFFDLLEANEESVRVAADEALTLILEGGCLEKFASDTDGTCESSICKRNDSLNGYSSIQELKEKNAKSSKKHEHLSAIIG